MRSVFRVNENNWDTDFCCFINDFRNKVGKSPVPHLPAHRLVETVCSFTNTCKVFNRECLLQNRCFENEKLRNTVIYISKSV